MFNYFRAIASKLLIYITHSFKKKYEYLHLLTFIDNIDIYQLSTWTNMLIYYVPYKTYENMEMKNIRPNKYN